MKLAYFSLAAVALAGSLMAAETKLDKPLIESLVRNLGAFAAQYKVEVGEGKPSQALPGFTEVNATITQGNGSRQVLLYVAPDGRHLVMGEAYDLKVDPFERVRASLKTEFQPSMGTVGAAVVIVEFSDFQCPVCREEAKILRENLLKDFPTQVRLYFKDYPLETIHDWSKAAALGARCVFRQKPSAFWDVHDYFYENQGTITRDNIRQKLLEFGTSKHLDGLQLSTCFDQKQSAKDVEKNQAEGRELGINATPTLFVNGRMLTGGLPWANLKPIIEFELDKAAKTGKKGEEACCTTELKTILPGTGVR